MSRISLTDVIHCIEEVPSLSQTPQKIAALIASDDASTEQVTALIEEDPGLEDRILAAVNSGDRRAASRITSVARAVTTLGFRAVQRHTVNAAVVGALKRYAGASVTEIWRRGFGAGVVARGIATHRHIGEPEDAFTLGLLQHIGQIIVLVRYPKQYADVQSQISDARLDVVTAEREVLGFDHQDVGYLLARRWRLPEPMVQVILHHHEPEAAGDFRQHAALAHLADTVACALGIGSDGDPHVRPLKLKPATFEALGVSFELLELICAQTLEQLPDFEAFHGAMRDSGSVLVDAPAP